MNNVEHKCYKQTKKAKNVFEYRKQYSSTYSNYIPLESMRLLSTGVVVDQHHS